MKEKLMRMFIVLCLVFGLTSCGGGGGGGGSKTPPGEITLEKITVSSNITGLAMGTSTTLSATGIYSDQSTADISDSVTWSSSDASVAAVSMEGARAVLTAKKMGQVTLTAWLGNLSATLVVTVSEAILDRIEISAGEGDVPMGLTRQIRASGVYSDGTVKDLTDTVLWASSDGNIAVIGNDSDSKGLMNALAVGTVTLSATLSGVTGDISGAAQVAVGQVTLQKFDISAGFRSIPVGLSRQIQATGLYSDQSLQDLTNNVTWTSLDTNVAIVANGNGVVTGLVPGTTTILAHIGASEARLILTVSDADLESLEISPDSVSIPVGFTQQFTATGLYSDKSTWDMTHDVVWGTSDAGVAIFDHSPERSGVFRALTEGSCEITAALGGVNDSVTVQVAQVELASVFINETGMILEKGTGAKLTVTGLFSDSSTLDLTDAVLWASDDPDIAQVDNGIDTKGHVYGIKDGVTRVTATIRGFEAASDVTVTETGINSIEIEASSDTLAAGTSMTLSATGYFNDGSERNITDSVLWESEDTDIAVVSNADGEKGQLRAYSAGTTTVTATFKGEIGQTAITVSLATLESIEVLQPDEEVPSGVSSQYQAIGHFSDGSEQDMTQKVAWSVSDKALASISNLSGLKGRLYTFSAGSLTVSAGYAEVTGQAFLTITGESLVGINLAPIFGLVEKGRTGTMVLQGLFSDGSVRDLSDDAIWLTANPEVFTVKNVKTEAGTILGHSAGQSYVLAIYSNLGFVKPVFVIDDLYFQAELVGAEIQFTVYGDYNSDKVVNITEFVTWSSDDENVVSVSNAEGEQGVGLIRGSGTCNITATYSDTLATTRMIEINP